MRNSVKGLHETPFVDKMMLHCHKCPFDRCRIQLRKLRGIFSTITVHTELEDRSPLSEISLSKQFPTLYRKYCQWCLLLEYVADLRCSALLYTGDMLLLLLTQCFIRNKIISLLLWFVLMFLFFFFPSHIKHDN